jgi:6-carboxyhexanoate--CoA ligase
MAAPTYYSIRMHASTGAVHLSGAERIITAERMDRTISELIDRARSKSGLPDRITVTIDNLGPEKPQLLQALDVILMPADGPEECRMTARQILLHAGVADSAIRDAIDLLSTGAAAHGQNMRGAMIMNARTGKRLEPDQARGVRASRFDWSPEAEPEIRKELEERGLSHFRTREALALATKVDHGPGVIAELCWSDDPGYTAGYVASLPNGYLRFPFMKQSGDDKGGRAIFIDPKKTDAGNVIEYLESKAVLINSLGCFRSACRPADFHTRT